jgi:hypothetical protein
MLPLFLRVTVLCIVFIFCCGFTSSPKPDKIPNSEHPLWDEFAKCRFIRDEIKNLTMIGYTPEVRKLHNKEIEISGFMVPLEPGKKLKHLLLNKLNPTCAFCPPNKPSEIMEVYTSTPVDWDENLAIFSGRLELVNDGRKRIFFVLKNAVKK